MIKEKTIRLSELKWVEVEEARKLGISVTAFLKLLIKQYFNNIKFKRERKEKVCRSSKTECFKSGYWLNEVD